MSTTPVVGMPITVPCPRCGKARETLHRFRQAAQAAIDDNSPKDGHVTLGLRRRYGSAGASAGPISPADLIIDCAHCKSTGIVLTEAGKAAVIAAGQELADLISAGVIANPEKRS